MDLLSLVRFASVAGRGSTTGCRSPASQAPAACGPGSFNSPRAGCWVRQRTYHGHSADDVFPLSAACGPRSPRIVDPAGSAWMRTPTRLPGPHLALAPI